MTDLAEAARRLLDEADAHLDHHVDADMQAAAERVRAGLAEGAPSASDCRSLLEEVRAWLDGADDDEMDEAAGELEAALDRTGPTP